MSIARVRRARALGVLLWGIASSGLAASGETPVPPSELGLLGAERATLEARYPGGLRSAPAQLPRSVGEQVMEVAGGREAEPAPRAPAGEGGERASGEPAFEAQERLARDAAERDVVRVEYDLDAGRVYRIRWRLAERFERPVFDALVQHLQARFGAPVYDQHVRAKLGSGKSDLRRAGWHVGEGRALDLRQLHPLAGGPLYVSVSERAALQQIVDSGRIALPEPETREPWWKGAQQAVSFPTPPERAELVAAFDALLDRLGLESAATP